MRIHLSHAGSRVRLGAITALATVCIAAPVLAAELGKPEKGKTYSGNIRKTEAGVKTNIPISFKVARTGKSVSKFKFSYPAYCQGGGFPTMKSRSAPISRQGTFTAKLPLTTVLPPAGKPAGHVTVTGKFGSGGKESGKVITDIKNSRFPKTCNGSSPYSTKAG